MNRAFTLCVSALITVLALTQTPLFAQGSNTPTAQPPPKQPAVFKPEELEQIAAPIALYPDALLAQVLMASTYPLEVVLAARWSKAHPQLKGDAASKEVEKESWDPAVKSLVVFPDVLAMMSEKIDWTQKLGDAFLAQQKEVMDAVQRLRSKAKAAGNLKSSDQMSVKTEPAPSGAPVTQTIIIESKDPEVVYVPTYDPTMMYGTWPYPAYPPYYYYPPGYVPGAAFFTFTAGVIIGGALWGNCNWGGGNVNINVNRNANFNRNEINHNRNNVGNRNNTGNKWEHNPEHRRGAEYRDSATQQKYGRGSSQQGLKSREEFRGRAAEGRQQISREGAGNQRDLSGNQIGSRDSAQSRDRGGNQSRDLGGTRDLGGGSNRDFGAAGGAQSRDLSGNRDFSGGDFGGGSSRDIGSSASRGSSSAFSGGSGSSARASSNRGGMSRGGGGGGSRGGGGRRR